MGGDEDTRGAGATGVGIQAGDRIGNAPFVAGRLQMLLPAYDSYGRKLRDSIRRCLMKCGQRKRCEYAQEYVGLA
jgi:hypothetical protein